MVNAVSGESEGTIHQYVDSAGHLLASGEPDPESLVINGQGYYSLP